MSTKTERISRIGRAELVRFGAGAAVLVVLCLVPLFITSAYLIHVFILTFIYIVAAASLRLITISGQFPLAHAGFMGIGAYSSAVLAKGLDITPWVTLFIGGFASMAIGALIGFPFARLRSLYYAMVSLFFGAGIIQVIIALQKWTNGYAGLTGIPPLLPGATSKVPYYYFFLSFMLLCLLAMYRFEFSRIGVTLKAIAQSHLVASSVGIDEAKYRVLALAVGCFFVGLTGAAYAHYTLTLSYSSFDLNATLWLVIYALIGGIGSFLGPAVGTALLIIIPELLRDLKEFVPYTSAAILLVVVYVMPKGLVGLPKLVQSLFQSRRIKKAVHVS